MRKHVVTKKEIAQLNMFRLNMQSKVLSLREMRQNLQEKTNLPKSNRFITCLTEEGILIRESRGMYKVPDEPIHIKKLQKAYDEHSALQAESNRKWRLKSVATVKMQVKAEDESKDEKIQRCIDYLKSLGYRIQKPIIKYEDV